MPIPSLPASNCVDAVLMAAPNRTNSTNPCRGYPRDFSVDQRIRDAGTFGRGGNDPQQASRPHRGKARCSAQPLEAVFLAQRRLREGRGGEPRAGQPPPACPADSQAPLPGLGLGG